MTDRKLRHHLTAAIVLAIAIAVPAPARDDPPPKPPNLAGVHIRDLVKAYAESWRDGDAKRYLTLIHATNDAEKKLADAIARYVAGSTALRKAAVKRFGEKAADEIFSHVDFPAACDRGRDLLKNLEEAEINVTGDSAVVEIEPVGRMNLVRIEDHWKVRVDFSQEDEGGKMAIGIMGAVARAQEATAKGIESGKHKTVAEASEAYSTGAE